MSRTLTTDPNRELSPLMWAALAKAASPSALGSWDYAAGVLGALKRAGLVQRVGVAYPYRPTTEGARRLRERAGSS